MSNRALKGPDEERTLDLLDELIGTIHRSRLSTFAARTRKHDKRQARRLELATQNASRHRNKQQLQFINEEVADEEDERVLGHMSAHFAVPPVLPSVMPQGPHRGAGPATSSASGKKVDALEQPKALFSNAPTSFSKLDDLQGDMKVRGRGIGRVRIRVSSARSMACRATYKHVSRY